MIDCATWVAFAFTYPGITLWVHSSPWMPVETFHKNTRDSEQDTDDLDCSHLPKHRRRTLSLNPVRCVQGEKHANSIADDENAR
jgi:hypothetical protein